MIDGEFWLGISANVAQVVGTIIPAIAITWAYWHFQCSVDNCRRHGSHKVAGTTYRVCHHHHHTEFHELLQEKHHQEHPDRLGYDDTV